MLNFSIFYADLKIYALFIQVVTDASNDQETVCQCNHLTNFALLMAEGNGKEGALAAATSGVDKGVIALQIFSYIVVILAILCLLALAYKVRIINIICQSEQSRRFPSK